MCDMECRRSVGALTCTHTRAVVVIAQPVVCMVDICVSINANFDVLNSLAVRPAPHRLVSRYAHATMFSQTSVMVARGTTAPSTMQPGRLSATLPKTTRAGASANSRTSVKSASHSTRAWKPWTRPSARVPRAAHGWAHAHAKAATTVTARAVTKVGVTLKAALPSLCSVAVPVHACGCACISMVRTALENQRTMPACALRASRSQDYAPLPLCCRKVVLS